MNLLNGHTKHELLMVTTLLLALVFLASRIGNFDANSVIVFTSPIIILLLITAVHILLGMDAVILDYVHDSICKNFFQICIFGAVIFSLNSYASMFLVFGV